MSPRPGTDLGSAGSQAILVLGAPRKCDLFGRLSGIVKVCPSYV